MRVRCRRVRRRVREGISAPDARETVLRQAREGDLIVVSYTLLQQAALHAIEQAADPEQHLEQQEALLRSPLELRELLRRGSQAEHLSAVLLLVLGLNVEIPRRMPWRVLREL